MGDIISLGLWIKRRRKALDLTQDELARRVGCSQETIRKIEADARRPSREIAGLLADKLELADDERAPFIQAARAELGTDRLDSAGPVGCARRVRARPVPVERRRRSWARPHHATEQSTHAADRADRARA